ncbi:hypothetical protein G6F37_008401 [Rhizopus arrhizus]|nr:hypothetical protein G6F38_008490 [Rhizopus arrhizus]KAG1155596.1 hypothetical protein G6F37_008401 [Rhizopus arrhizus]
MGQHSKFPNYYLIMDNAPIHKAMAIDELIIIRGYRCIYLPQYSPQLSPIEQFWSAMKSKVRRHELKS